MLKQFCRTTVPNKWPVQCTSREASSQRNGGEWCSVTTVPLAVCHRHRPTNQRSAKVTARMKTQRAVETHCLGMSTLKTHSSIVFLRVNSGDAKPAQNGTRGPVDSWQSAVTRGRRRTSPREVNSMNQETNIETYHSQQALLWFN